MGAANKRKWDIVNLLLRRGANATLLDIVCCSLQLEVIDLFITKLTQHTIE
jgi:hypothetical protein